jgi:hypothetical protein
MNYRLGGVDPALGQNYLREVGIVTSGLSGGLSDGSLGLGGISTVKSSSKITESKVVNSVEQSIEIDVNIGRLGLVAEVAVVLGGVSHSSLVLLLGGLGSLLGLLGVLLVGGSLLSLLLGLGSSLLGLLCGLSSGLSGTGLLLPLLGLLGLLVGLLEHLDSGIEGQSKVNGLSESGSVLGLVLLSLGLVLLLNVSLVVSVGRVIGNILVEVLKGSPRVEGVHGGVEALHLGLGRLHGTKRRTGLGLGESDLGVEEGTPQLDEVLGGGLLLGGLLHIGSLVDGVVLSSSVGVHQNLKRLLDTLEEVVLVELGAGGGLLIGVMLEHSLSVGPSDLVLGSSVSKVRDTQNSVMVLRLPVLGLSLEILNVFRLVAEIGVLILALDLLDVLGGLLLLVLRPSSASQSSSRMGQEPGSNGLNLSLDRRGEGGVGNKALGVGRSPSGRKSRQRHGVVVLV